MSLRDELLDAIAQKLASGSYGGITAADLREVLSDFVAALAQSDDRLAVIEPPTLDFSRPKNAALGIVLLGA